MKITIDPENLYEVQLLMDTIKSIHTGDNYSYTKFEAQIFEREFTGLIIAQNGEEINGWGDWKQTYPVLKEMQEKDT